LVVSAGPESIVASGASTVQWRLAGVSSIVPAELFARTRSSWSPMVRPSST
jgi:hypothetical protein